MPLSISGASLPAPGWQFKSCAFRGGAHRLAVEQIRSSPDGDSAHRNDGVLVEVEVVEANERLPEPFGNVVDHGPRGRLRETARLALLDERLAVYLEQGDLQADAAAHLALQLAIGHGAERVMEPGEADFAIIERYRRVLILVVSRAVSRQLALFAPVPHRQFRDRRQDARGVSPVRFGASCGPSRALTRGETKRAGSSSPYLARPLRA